MYRDLRAEGWGPEDCYPESEAGKSSDVSSDYGYLVRRFGVDAIQAAYDAVDQNDGVDWGMLERVCPDDLELDDFIDLLVGAKKGELDEGRNCN